MTIKLYENNVLLKACQCIVTACEERNGLYFIQVDQTVFYPEGGGQLSDRGTLGGVQVVHVSEKNGCIYHECQQPLEIGAQVEAKLDWQVRRDRMQQHCGEHLLSYAVYKLFQANNVGFRMNEELVSIDLDKELTDAELLQAQQLTNEIIWENRPIHIEYVDSSEAGRYKDKMRKFNDKLTGLLRIVEIEDADVCTCCGTHPPFTGMVGCVKVVRHEKHKQGCRVEFLCGARAMADADRKNETVLGLAREFSAKPEDVTEYFAKYKADTEALKEALKQKPCSCWSLNWKKSCSRHLWLPMALKFSVCLLKEEMARKANCCCPS